MCPFFLSASEFTVCKTVDSKCMSNTATKIVRAAANSNGLPALRIPSLNPLKIQDMTIKQGADSPVNIVVTFKDADLLGLETISFRNIS